MKRKQTKVDPKFVSQLKEASASQGTIQAVFTLDLPKKMLFEPKEVQAATERILHKVEQAVGKKAQDYNVFRNMGAFVVEAEASLVEALIEEPEIASATANQQGQSVAAK